MSLGVRSKLIDLKTGEFMWAIDETFDAGHASVIVGASEFQEIAQVRAFHKGQMVAFCTSKNLPKICCFHHLLNLTEEINKYYCIIHNI